MTDQIAIGLQAYGALGEQVQADAESYLAGLNAYIAEAKLNPNKMPGEYAAINQPQGPTNFGQSDIIAIASLVGGIFGKGGGRELAEMQLLADFQQRFGARKGRTAVAPVGGVRGPRRADDASARSASPTRCRAQGAARRRGAGRPGHVQAGRRRRRRAPARTDRSAGGRPSRASSRAASPPRRCPTR